jgi:hypothetical protein
VVGKVLQVLLVVEEEMELKVLLELPEPQVQ